MRLATIKTNGSEKAGIVLSGGVLPIEALNAAKGTAWAEDTMSLIQKQQIPGLTKWYNEGGKDELAAIPGLVPNADVVYGPLYRNSETHLRNRSQLSRPCRRHRLRSTERIPGASQMPTQLDRTWR